MMKMSKMKIVFGICLLLIVVGCAAYNSSGRRGTVTITPYDYGLREAKTGIETYWAIYNAHKAAIAAGTDVNYDGIDHLEIEIPKDAKSIPLTTHNDFKGLKLYVSNTTKDFFLFSKEENAKDISVEKSDIDKGDFTKHESLRKGLHILTISDKNPWVDNRVGYSYGHTRKDVLLIENGHALNNTIYPYDNDESNPVCGFYEVDEPIVFENIHFKRSTNAAYKTFLFAIRGNNDVKIKNVTAVTPSSEMVNDYMMRIYDCTYVTFENVNIENTYSRKDHSGYGIELNNVWNFVAKNLVCKAKWGIFGNNNVNTATLEDCTINRFDVHCYGKDIRFLNVRFEELYNQFSSMYGEIVFNRCHFDRFVPVLYESAYNAFTPHDIYFKECDVTLSADHNYLINTGNILSEKNRRKPVIEKCFPNVIIKNMKVHLPSSVREMLIFREGADTDKELEIGYIDKISIDGIVFIYQGKELPVNLQLSRLDINTTKDLQIELKNISVVTGNDGDRTNASGTITMGLNRRKQNRIISIKKVDNFKIKD